MGSETGFSWACGAMPNMSSVFRHSLGCIYMCLGLQLILVLQVAVVCFCVWFCVCFVWFLCSVSDLD